MTAGLAWLSTTKAGCRIVSGAMGVLSTCNGTAGFHAGDGQGCNLPTETATGNVVITARH